ncbi:hypothetical protein EV426DRAFT_711387 [Tirmania nivea]|nr:hypothetical protein EV426DRAFT_711387 [Tirmania nivea]
MSGGKDVVFGPIKDWGKKGIKVLLRNGEQSRQYTLEGITEWAKLDRFNELNGGDILRKAAERAEEEASRLVGEPEAFTMKYSREERASRASSETLVVRDGTTVERALEIISSGVVIQDLTEAGNIPASAVSSVRRIEGDEEVEAVAVRLGDGVRSWEIRTPKTRRIAERGSLVMSQIRKDSDESDCERTLRVSRRKGKGRMPGDCLRQLAKDLTSLGEAFPPPPVGEGTARRLFQMGREVPDSQVCVEGEWAGRRFGSWAEIDCLKAVVKKEMVGGTEIPRKRIRRIPLKFSPSLRGKAPTSMSSCF